MSPNDGGAKSRKAARTYAPFQARMIAKPRQYQAIYLGTVVAWIDSKLGARGPGMDDRVTS